MSDVIKVGLHLDIEDDLSQFITNIDDVAKEAGNKLSESASREIQSLKKEASDIRDILKNTIKGKASSDTVSKLGEKVQELSIRTTALEENMKALVDTMSDVDNGKFKSALSGIVTAMQSLQDNTVNSIEVLNSFKKTVSTKMGDKVNFVDTSQTDELEKQVHLLQDLQKTIGKKANVELTAKNNLGKTTKELSELSFEIAKLEEELEDLRDDKKHTNSKNTYYDEKLQQLVEARNKFNTFYEQATSQTTKNGVIVANGIKKDFKAEYDAYKTGYKEIEDLISERINILNSKRAELGSQPALEYNERNTSLNIPLYISTRQTTLYKEATTLIENVQNKLDAGDQAIRVNFILKSPYSSKDTNNILDDLGMQINKLQDGELKQDFSNLYAKLTEDFKHEIEIHITSDIEDEEQKVKDSIDAIKAKLTESIHIFPEIEVSKEQLKRIQSNLDDVSKTLTLNIDKIQLNNETIKEITGNKEETASEIMAKLNKRRKINEQDTAGTIENLKKINKQLSDILNSLKMITGESENIENPLITIIDSLDRFADTLKTAFHMGDSVNLEAMFTNMQQAVSKINGKLSGNPQKNPIVLQLRAIVETYKEYKKLGGEHDLLELGGAENVQRWLKKYHPGEIAKEQPKLYIPEFDIQGEGKDLGSSLGLGYAEGIRDSIPSIEAASREMVYAAVEAIKTAQDSHSPSRVAEQLGIYWGEGYTEGILDTDSKLKNAIRALIEGGKITADDLVEDTVHSKISNKVLNEITADKKPTKNAEKYLETIKEIDSFFNQISLIEGSKVFKGIENVESRIAEFTKQIRDNLLEATEAFEEFIKLSSYDQNDLSKQDEKSKTIKRGFINYNNDASVFLHQDFQKLYDKTKHIVDNDDINKEYNDLVNYFSNLVIKKSQNWGSFNSDLASKIMIGLEKYMQSRNRKELDDISDIINNPNFSYAKFANSVNSLLTHIQTSDKVDSNQKIISDLSKRHNELNNILKTINNPNQEFTDIQKEIFEIKLAASKMGYKYDAIDKNFHFDENYYRQSQSSYDRYKYKTYDKYDSGIMVGEADNFSNFGNPGPAEVKYLINWRKNIDELLSVFKSKDLSNFTVEEISDIDEKYTKLLKTYNNYNYNDAFLNPLLEKQPLEEIEYLITSWVTLQEKQESLNKSDISSELKEATHTAEDFDKILKEAKVSFGDLGNIAANQAFNEEFNDIKRAFIEGRESAENIIPVLTEVYNRIQDTLNNPLEDQPFEQAKENIKEQTTALSKEAEQAVETRQEIKKLNEETAKNNKSLTVTQRFNMLKDIVAKGSHTPEQIAENYRLYQTKYKGKKGLNYLTKDKEKLTSIQTAYDEIIRKEKEKEKTTEQSTRAVKKQTTAISQEGQQVDKTKEKVKELNKEIEKPNKKSSKVAAKAPDANKQALNQKFDELKQMYTNGTIDNKVAVDQFKIYQARGGNKELSDLANNKKQLKALQDLYNGIVATEEKVSNKTKEVNTSMQAQTQSVEKLEKSVGEADTVVEKFIVSDEEWERLMRESQDYTDEYYDNYIDDAHQAKVTTEEFIESAKGLSNLRDPLTSGTFKKLFEMTEDAKQLVENNGTIDQVVKENPNKAVANQILDLRNKFLETGDSKHAKKIKTIAEKSNLSDEIKKSIDYSINKLFSNYGKQINTTVESATRKAATEMVTKVLKETDYKKYLKFNKINGFTDNESFNYNFGLHKKELLENGLAKQTYYTRNGKKKKGRVLYTVTDTPESFDFINNPELLNEDKYKTSRAKLSKKQKSSALEYRNLTRESSIYDDYDKAVDKRRRKLEKEQTSLDKKLKIIDELFNEYKKKNNELNNLEEESNEIKNKNSKKYKEIQELIVAKKNEIKELDNRINSLNESSTQTDKTSISTSEKKTIGLKKETIELKKNTAEQKANNQVKNEAPKQKQIHRDQLFANIQKYVGEFDNFDRRSSKKREALDKIIKNYDAYKKANGEKNIGDLTDNPQKIEAITKAYNKYTSEINKNTDAKKENKVADKETNKSSVNPAPITRVLGNKLGNTLTEAIAPNIQQKATELVQTQIQANNKTEESAKKSKKAAKDEAQSMDDVKTSAISAAQSKENFAVANREVLDSIVSSVKELDNEGKAFENLNKLINTLGGNKSDEKIDKVKKGLKEIIEVFKTPLTGNSLIESLERIALSGSNLSDIATILKASKKDLSETINSLENLNSINADDLLSKQSDVIRTNAIRELENLGGDGSRYINLSMKTTKDNLIEIVGLVKSADNSIREFTLHTKDGIDMQNVGMNENTAQIAKQMKIYAQVQQYFEKLKANGRNIVTDPFFNPEADEESKEIWQMILNYAEKYKDVLGDIHSITQQTRQSEGLAGEPLKQSFSINGSFGHLTFGPDGVVVASNQNNLLNVDALIDKIKELSSVRKEYINLTEKYSTGNLTNNEIQRLNELKSKYSEIESELKVIEQSIGSDNMAMKEFVEYNQKLALDYDTILSKYIDKSSEKISKAQLTKSNQRTDFIASFKVSINEIMKSGGILEKLNQELGKPFDQQNQTLISQYKQKIDTVIDGLTDLNNVAAKQGDVSKLLSKVAKDRNDNSAMGKELKNQYNDLINRLKEIISTADKTTDGLVNISKVDLGKLTDEFNNLHAEMLETEQTGKSFFHSLADAVKSQTTQFIATYFSLQDFIRYGREALQTVVNIDTALTELRKVSDASTTRLNQSLSKSAETAAELGKSINEVVYSTADWARLGYDVDAAEELARITTLYQNVGDNISQTDASEQLISTLQGFQLGVEESERIIDKYNEVANNFAIDTAGIGEALKRSAASFNAANTDLSKSIALITATNEVVQDPDSVGTLWKTLSARIRGAKTELQELGEEEDQFTETTSKLRGLVMSLTGFDIMKDKDTFKDIYEIILGIGERWDQLTDVEQASLGEALAGKRNANALYAVLGNLDTLQEAYKAAEESAGSASHEQQNFEKSIEFSLNRIKATAQEVAMDTVDSEFIKNIVDFGNDALRVIDQIVERSSTLPATIAAIGSAILSIKAQVKGEDMAFNIFGIQPGKVKESVNAFKQSFGTEMFKQASQTDFYKNMQTLSDSLKGYDFSNLREGSVVFDKLATEAGVSRDALEKFVLSQKSVDISARDLQKALGNEEGQIIANTVATKANTVAQYAWAAAKKVAQGLLQAAAWAAVTYAITKAAEAINNYVHREEHALEAMEQAQQKISNLNKKFEDSKKYIEDNIALYNELSQGVSETGKNIKLSSEDYQTYLDINNQFAEKFPTLITGFNDQGQAILNIGNSAEETIEKLKEQIKWEEKLANIEIGKQIGTLQEGTQTKKEQLDNLKADTEGYSDYYDRYLKEIDKITNEKNNDFIRLGNFNMSNAGDNLAFQSVYNAIQEFRSLSGTLLNSSDILQYTDDYQNVLLDMSKLTENEKTKLVELINANKNEILKAYSTSNTETLQAQSEFDVSFAKTMDAISQSMQVGVFENFDENTQNLSVALVKGLKSSLSQIVTDGDYEKYVEDNIIAQFNSIPEEKREEISKIYADLLAFNWDDGSVEENATKIRSFINLLIQNGFTNTDQIDWSKIFDNQSIEVSEQLNNSLRSIATQNGLYHFDEVEDGFIRLQSYTQGFSEKQAKLWLEVTNGAKTATEAIKMYEAAQTQAANAEPIEPFDRKFFSESITDLSTLSAAYDKFAEKVKNKNKNLSFDIGDIEGLREKFGDLETADFDVFEKIVTDANSTKDQVQAAFDEMATAWVNAKLDLSNATIDDIGSIQTQLELQGLLTEGVKEYVNAKVMQNDVEKSVNNDLIVGNQLNIARLSILQNEQEELGVTNEALGNYILKFAEASGMKLTGDISWIKTLIEQLNLGSNALMRFRQQMSLAGGSSTKNLTSIGSADFKKAQALIAKQHQISQEIQESAKSKENAKGGGGGGGAKDEAEKTVDIMAELSKQLDEIQSKWESLTDILNNYNETGKVTIDQAQELFQTDWKYLALLGDGTGIVQNADEAFQSLAEAKINEMRVQLARNAIDAINGLNDEAEAAKYLTNAYLDLKEGALAAEEQILMTALATKRAAGGNIAAAAEMIYKGYQNAKMLTANIDYSKKSKDDSSKDKDKDKESKEKEYNSKEKEKENKYSKDFNWIERLLERLAKLTEKWTKQADRFFTYWNKNWAVDKAIKANNNEIKATQQAMYYYQSEASKIKLDPLIKEKVQNGSIDIETVKSQKMGESIEKFIDLFDKITDNQEKINELYEKERELIKQKLDNIVEYFGTIEDYYSSILSLVNARIETKTSSGQRTSINDLLERYAKENDLKNVTEEADMAYKTGASQVTRASEEVQKDIDSLRNDVSTTDYYKSLIEQRKELQDRQDAYDTKHKEIEDLTAKYKAETDKAKKKELKKELDAAKKEQKKLKLSSKDSKQLNSLNAQLNTIQNEIGNAQVDSNVTSTAKYKELVKKISDLQSKKKLNKTQEKNLKKYLSELDEINAGVAYDKLTEFMNAYEKWYDLNSKTKLSQKELIEKNKLEDTLNEIRSGYTSSLDSLQTELKDALISEGTESADAERMLNKQKEDLKKSYDSQYNNILNSYTNTSIYQKKLAEYENLLQTKKNKEAKNKKLTKKEQAKLDKLTQELDALRQGATDQNISEYITAWEYIYENQAKYVSGKLKGTAATKYDEYVKTIKKYNDAKIEELNSLKTGYDDAIKQATIEYDKQVKENEATVEEQKQQLWNTAKEIANWQVNSIQYLINALDTTINQYKSVVELLENTSLSKLNNYGILEFLGLDGDASIEELLTQQLSGAVIAAENKIAPLIEQGNLLQELIDAGNKNSFAGIFAKYRENSSAETRKYIDKMVEQLNSNDYSANDWMDEWQTQLSNIISQLGSTTQEVQQFKDQLRENVYFKAINTAIEQVESLNGKLSSTIGLIKDEWTTDDNGITEYGLAKVNLLAKELNNAQIVVGQYADKIRMIEALEEDDLGGYASQEEKIKALNQAYSDYASSLSNVQSIEDQIYQIGKEVAEEELEAIRKTTQAYKDCLASKKSLYDYDKSIQEKSRNIDALKAQIAALNGVSDAASKAKVRQLQEQLQNAEEELAEQKKEHEFDMQNQALDKLISDMEDALNNVAKTIDESFEEYSRVVQETIEKSVGTDVNGSLNKIYHLLLDPENAVADEDNKIAEENQKITEQNQFIQDQIDQKRDELDAFNYLIKEYKGNVAYWEDFVARTSNQFYKDHAQAELEIAINRLNSVTTASETLANEITALQGQIVSTAETSSDILHTSTGSRTTSDIEIATEGGTYTALENYQPATEASLISMGKNINIISQLLGDAKVLLADSITSTNSITTVLDSMQNKSEEYLQSIQSDVSAIRNNMDIKLSDLQESILSLNKTTTTNTQNTVDSVYKQLAWDFKRSGKSVKQH